MRRSFFVGLAVLVAAITLGTSVVATWGWLTGNAGAAPPGPSVSAGRVIQLENNVFLGSLGQLASPLVDTSDCHSITILTHAPSGNIAPQAVLWVGPVGGVAAGPPSSSLHNVVGEFYERVDYYTLPNSPNIPLVAPTVQVMFLSSDPDGTTFSAELLCGR